MEDSISRGRGETTSSLQVPLSATFKFILIFSGCTAITVDVDQRSSSLEGEKQQFKVIYNFVINKADGDLNPEDKALQTFELWWTSWIARQQALRQTQQRMSQMALQETVETQNEYPEVEETQFSRPGRFVQNETPFKQRAVKPRVSSHPQPLHHSSSGQEFQDTISPARRSASDPTFGQPFYGQLPGYSEPLPSNVVPTVTQLQGQQKEYQSEYASPGIINRENRPSPSSTFDSQGALFGYQAAINMSYDHFNNLNNYIADHSQYNNGFTESQNPQPQHLQHQGYTYNPNPNQPYPICQQQRYASASGAVFDQQPAPNSQPTHLLQEAFPYPKPNPKRSIHPYASEPGCSDPNGTPSAY